MYIEIVDFILVWKLYIILQIIWKRTFVTIE